MTAPSLWLRGLLGYSITLAAGILLSIVGAVLLLDLRMPSRRAANRPARPDASSRDPLRPALIGAWALLACGAGAIALHIAFER